MVQKYVQSWSQCSSQLPMMAVTSANPNCNMQSCCKIEFFGKKYLTVQLFFMNNMNHLICNYTNNFATHQACKSKAHPQDK